MLPSGFATPTTVKRLPPMTTSLPGIPGGEPSADARSLPRTHTLALARSSASLKNLPWSMDMLATSISEAASPLMRTPSTDLPPQETVAPDPDLQVTAPAVVIRSESCRACSTVRSGQLLDSIHASRSSNPPLNLLISKTLAPRTESN